MTRVNGVKIGLLLLAAVLLLATGCNLRKLDVGPVQTDQETVETGAAEMVTVEITMGAGQLDVSGGANELLEAEFTYNVEAWRPEVSYDVSDGQGRLAIAQPDTDEGLPFTTDELRYEWDLQFNEAMPIDMEITMGAGDGQLELDSLTLNSLRFEGGAGDVDIDLSSSTIRDLNVRMGAGDVRVDLGGDWQQNLSADLKGGVGRATVVLPSNVGVRVEAKGGLGQVNATGLNRDGDVYTNDAYGQSEVTLEIQVEGGLGEINLELAE